MEQQATGGHPEHILQTSVVRAQDSHALLQGNLDQLV
jgi:hypothetical protein